MKSSSPMIFLLNTWLSSSNDDHEMSWIPKVIKKRVCTAFVEDPLSNGDQCQCGGARGLHGSVATGDYFGSAIVTQWDSSKHTSECPSDAFGELKFAGIARRQSHFLRLSCDTPASLVYAILTQHWGLPPPNLVVSVVGGVGQEKVRSWVREVVRQGLVRAAQSTGAWIVTGGLREGVGRCVGEAVRDHGTAAASQSKVVALGVAPWGLVANRHQLVNAEGSFPARYYVQNTSRDSCYLDSNYQAFLLVDDGSVGRRGGETSFITNLEKFISHQRTGIWGSGSIEIPVLCMLISGDASVLKRMDMSLKKTTPWLVLNGSGPAADMISELLSDLSRAASPVDGEGRDSSSFNHELRDRVREIIKKHFPLEKTLEKLVDQALSIYQKRSLITVFHGEQDSPDDFDTVILRALVRASKQVNSNSSEYTEELKLAVAWNRVDIAKSELFNGDIQWKYDDLKDSMTDALVNDKPQFVRLFTENGLNILEYLTYERLESLYQSLSSSTLAYTLLQTWLRERHSLASSQTCSPDSDGGNCKGLKSPVTGPSSARGLSLFEVSRLLGEVFGGMCQPFYYVPLGLEPGVSLRKAAKHVNKILQGDCAYRHQQVAFPWSSLFIWAILQNRSEMAIFFWEMAGESVMSALSACKILRELSKLENETETCLSMKDLAQKFEILAHDMFSACCQSNETRSLTLLIRMSPFWGGATCLQMATAADARLFFSHDGVQTLLAQIWWGDMHSRTEVWKLIMTFFLPPLIYTNLITFREHQERHKDGLEGSRTVAFSLPDITQHMDDDIKLEDNAHGGEGDNVDGSHIYSLTDITHTDEDLEEHTALTKDYKGKHASVHKHPYVVHRWRQFWFAPVTSFLGNVLMYFLFLILFAYVLLVEFKPPPPVGPAPIEYLLYFWVFTLVCEEIRQSFVSGSGSFSQSMELYIQDMWNKCDLTAIVLFILGLICRMFDWSYEFGRSVLCVDYMVFTLRLIHIFAVNKHLGPKIIIVGKMVKDVFFFLFFLGVWLLAYGVANQALIYAYDPRPYWVIRRVFYRPYLHIFGQIPLDEIDAHKRIQKVCTNNVTLIQQGAEPCPQSEANWLVLILLSIYLLVTNVLLLNLLIAMFSYTFSKVQEHSDVHWKFQRYNLIVEYHSRPCLAPPFIILSHLRLFIKRTIRKVPSVKIKHFMLDLRGRKASRLNTWEAVQKENLLSTQSKKLRDSDTERLRRTSAKVDSMLKQMAEIRDQDRRLRMLESELEYCSSSLSWIMEELAQSDLIKHTRRPPVHRESVPPTSPT
ncbi:transient receptor potential cation channel subfamily M member 4a isoform X1 [Pangasianodon hypophthalmus]|uniref:transient receptor potential cation channel subfamily M member 4a isoform X1 n=1 Tax=Pangasianodon hypophthalmus TaxID=310915 RepID=UPI002307FF0F|nr:transient receptor potential cation channel subfamily M member 4a isoform X1 [Pangasianodon hypophthalmus]